jgi:hypothetical protein
VPDPVQNNTRGPLPLCSQYSSAPFTRSTGTLPPVHAGRPDYPARQRYLHAGGAH